MIDSRLRALSTATLAAVAIALTGPAVASAAPGAAAPSSPVSSEVVTDDLPAADANDADADADAGQPAAPSPSPSPVPTEDVDDELPAESADPIIDGGTDEEPFEPIDGEVEAAPTAPEESEVATDAVLIAAEEFYRDLTIPIDGVADFGPASAFSPITQGVDPERVTYFFYASGAGELVQSGELKTPEGVWSVDPVTTVVTFTPLPGYAGNVPALGVTASVVTMDGGSRAHGNLFVEIDDVELTARDGLDRVPVGWTAFFAPLVTLVTPGQSEVLGVELVDPIDGPTMADSVEVPGEGTWRIDDATGHITFEPLPGFAGPVTPLGYVAWDANGNNARALLRVELLVRPTASDASATVTAGSPAVFDLDAITAAGTAPTTEWALVSPATGAAVRDLTVTVPGEGLWYLDLANRDISFFAEEGFTGTTTPFEYVVRDADALSNSGTLTVTVLPAAAVAPHPTSPATGHRPHGALAATGADGAAVAGGAATGLVLVGGTLLALRRRGARGSSAPVTNGELG
ncbi:hypothetical protein [Serinibacter arcticus]|uniref:Putative hemagglutinin/hemolysin-related protein n=1 Tax=Serinibacter arcticus TaxID=1655435 RepID=A0A4Z1E3M6_9MICO|nr:hypothetical protein [Serinibacter arcticus]TGO06705.1 putative hemagglutinin/hemolysin-related protein [Serinibacter arcticus]